MGKASRRAAAQQRNAPGPAPLPIAPPAPPPVPFLREEVRLDEMPHIARIPEPAIAPRKFGKPRVYHLDGGFKVTVSGDEDALEGDFAVSSEQDSLRIFTCDAAIQRRIARQTAAEQQPMGSTPHLDRFVQTSGQGSRSARAPEHVGGPVHIPGVYDGTTPRPRDAQDAVLADPDINMNMNALGAAVGLYSEA